MKKCWMIFMCFPVLNLWIMNYYHRFSNLYKAVIMIRATSSNISTKKRKMKNPIRPLDWPRGIIRLWVQFWLEMDLHARIIPAAFLFQISADILSIPGRVGSSACTSDCSRVVWGRLWAASCRSLNSKACVGAHNSICDDSLQQSGVLCQITSTILDLAVQHPQRGDSEPDQICWQGSLQLMGLQVCAQASVTGLGINYSYRSWWWWVLRWGERSQTLLEGGWPRHACAVARRSAGCVITRQSRLTSQVNTAWLVWRKNKLPAWAGCSHPCGKVWWRSAGTPLTSSGVGAWRTGRPRRKNAPSDSRRSPRRSSAGLCCNCRRHTDGLMVMLKY